jgi:dipeptidyl-peptidase-4
LQKNSNPLKDYKMPAMSIFTIKAKDSTDLYCRLIKPTDFDPAKKYPVIVYVYGGPHDQMITDSWLGGTGMFLHYLATKGYVVFTLDNHGSANRGLAFEQATFRNLGAIELEDQMLGVDYLKKLPFVDTSRIGVHGWSYGGFMTVSLMLKQSNTFKVAVAGGPVIDWKFYEVMYGERYMDTPDENPLGYDNANLLNYAKNLKGKLLIIHGTADPTVVWQNSLSFVRKCIDEGVQLDYFVYPEQEHNMTGKDRVHLNHKIENYFNDYLK